ncbi:MAG: hypothetical protein KatS3mg102_2461 [Planctomycetota bacterium]|nr:MAG: hypothetical protein KatS3mg102_2461 [Planctomycetota bacterium]
MGPGPRARSCGLTGGGLAAVLLLVLGLAPARADVELRDEPAPASPGAGPALEEPRAPPPSERVLPEPGEELQAAEQPRPVPPARFGASAELWVARLGGEFEFERGGVGERLELGHELPLDRWEPALRLSGWIQLGLVGLEGGYLHADFTGRGVLQEPVSHAGAQFDAGERVRTSVELQTAYAGLVLMPIRQPLRFGVSVGALWVSERVRLTSREPAGASAGGRDEVFSPYLGLLLDLPVVDRRGHGVGLEGEMRLFGWADGDEAFAHLEVHARLYAQLAGRVRAWVGLAWLGFEHERLARDDREMEVSLGALTLGLSLLY